MPSRELPLEEQVADDLLYGEDDRASDFIYVGQDDGLVVAYHYSPGGRRIGTYAVSVTLVPVDPYTHQPLEEPA